MEVVADSSVLVAAFHAEDSQHKKAADLLQKTPKPLLVPEYIAVETAGVLLVRAGRSHAQEFIRILSEAGDLRLLPSPEGFFSAIATLYLTIERTLSFVDCSLLALSRKFSIATFDRVLLKAIRDNYRV